MEPTIKDYELVAELSRGGMGRVYLARQRYAGPDAEPFAIKVLHAHLAGDPQAKLMMLDEAHTAARVKHANVTSVVDIGCYERGYYLVMEYVEGCSLEALLAHSPKERPPHLIIPVVLDMLKGLHAAHTLADPNGDPYEIVHRDVSPHNVLVGVDGIGRITDFGIATARERYTATALGMKKGKAPFMAPEQLRGAKPDVQFDVWAAGVTLFVALTGTFPFGETVSAATFSAILQGDVPVPSQTGLRPPACLDWVIMGALQRHRAARFPTAEAFADSLHCVAVRHGLLGTRSEISEWVEDAWGEKLWALRRAFRAGHAEASSALSPSSPPPSAPSLEDLETREMDLELPTQVYSVVPRGAALRTSTSL